MKYQMWDGNVYEGNTGRDIVNQMAGTKMSPVRNRKAYMRATAKRVEDAYSFKVQANGTYQQFLDDLEAAGLIKRLS